MNGGSLAQSAFRYQDWCILYTLLMVYEQDEFQYIICENEKLDFECWHDKKFDGYQVKSNPKRIVAKEINEILNFFLKRSGDNLEKSELIFFFTERPKSCLSQLFDQLACKALKPKVRHKTAEKFINNALKDLSKNPLNVSFKVFTKKEIEDLVWGLAKNILQNLYRERNLNFFICDTFVKHLKDRIEQLSSNQNLEERKISKADILLLCKNLESSSLAITKNGQQKKKTFKLPDDPSYEVIIRKRLIAQEPSPLLANATPSSDINDLTH